MRGEDPGGLNQQLVNVPEEQEVDWLELCVLVVPVEEALEDLLDRIELVDFIVEAFDIWGEMCEVRVV